MSIDFSIYFEMVFYGIILLISVMPLALLVIVINVLMAGDHPFIAFGLSIVVCVLGVPLVTLVLANLFY